MQQDANDHFPQKKKQHVLLGLLGLMGKIMVNWGKMVNCDETICGFLSVSAKICLDKTIWMLQQWIGLGENLQENMDFPVKTGIWFKLGRII